MASNDDGYLVHDGGGAMNAVADVATARRLATAIEDHTARRLRLPVAKARPRVASRLGAAPGTLENLRRDRLKSIPSWLMARIRAEFIRVLQAQVQALEADISFHRQAGADHRSDDLAAAEAQIREAKKILSGCA